MARATPAHPGKMLYFFHIVKEQPISSGQKPEANRAPRAPLASALSAYRLVELDGIEPTTPCLQSRCSPN